MMKRIKYFLFLFFLSSQFSVNVCQTLTSANKIKNQTDLDTQPMPASDYFSYKMDYTFSEGDAPVLYSPANGIITKGDMWSIPFTWSKPEGALKFRIQIAKDSLFTDMALDDSTFSADTVVILNDFRVVKVYYYSKYYWRVSAKFLSGFGPWSAIWSFGFIPRDIIEDGLPGTVKYDNDAATAIKDMTVTLTAWYGDITESVTTNEQGKFTIYGNLPTGTYELIVSKTGWLGANATDALLVAKQYVGTVTLADVKLTAADVNNSGTINTTDALLVLKRSVDSSIVFEKGDWVNAPGYFYMLYNPPDVDIKVLATGDVNGSNTPLFSKAAPTVTVTTEKAILSKTNVINVPVKVATDLNVGAMTLKFSYPSNLVSFESLSSKEDNIQFYDDKKGKVALAWADLSGKDGIYLKAGEAIVTLQFKSKEELKAGSVINVELDGAASEIASSSGEVVNAGLIIPILETASPTQFSLNQNYPNPFNPATIIKYEIPVNAKVILTVFNILGEELAVLVNEQQNAGLYEVNFDASDVTSGIYFYRIIVNSGNQNFTQTNKMILMK